MARLSLVSVLLSALALVALNRAAPADPATQDEQPTLWTYRVVNTYPHDAQAFTQGLAVADGALFESTGRFGQSSLRRVDLTSGTVIQRRGLDTSYFAEGLTTWKGQLLQLTWQARLGFVYDLATLGPVRTFDYAGEGWGLTHDGSRLILSDGSAKLRFLDPSTFAETGLVTVREAGRPVEYLNELEFVRGEVFANVWHSDRVARIDAASGAVRGWIDFSGLLAPGDVTDPEAVLNGIAYDADADRLFVTGKLWPALFEVVLERAQPVSPGVGGGS